MVNYIRIYGISRIAEELWGVFWHSAGENYSTVSTLVFSNLCLVWIITYFLCNLIYLFQFWARMLFLVFTDALSSLCS